MWLVHQTSPFDVWCMQKVARTPSVYDTYCLGHWNEENERKNKNIKLNGWSFFFNLCKPFVSLNVVLPCMTSEKRENWVNIFISMAYIKRSHVSLLDLWQNNLNNPRAYSEPGQTPKMEYFVKIANS